MSATGILCDLQPSFSKSYVERNIALFVTLLVCTLPLLSIKRNCRDLRSVTNFCLCHKTHLCNKPDKQQHSTLNSVDPSESSFFRRNSKFCSTGIFFCCITSIKARTTLKDARHTISKYNEGAKDLRIPCAASYKASIALRSIQINLNRVEVTM